MWSAILIVSAIAAVLCGLSAIMLRLQPLDATPGLINRIAGLTIGRGFSIGRRLVGNRQLPGDLQLIIATLAAWLMWSIAGGVTIAIAWPGYDPQRMWLIYGLLSAIVGGAVGFGLAFLASERYAKITRMSTFEGAAGYFVVFMSLIGGVIGALTLGIGMTLFFHQQGQ